MNSNNKDYLTNSPKNALRILSDDKSVKRRDYLAWDEYFMGITFLESRKSEGTHDTDAAIILNCRQIIVSMASGGASNEHNRINESHVNHAEYKALHKIQEATAMYTTTFPCVKCAEVIVDSGIVQLIYYQDNANSDTAKEVLREGGVTYRQFVNRRKMIEIDFSQFDEDSS